jgi:RNA polymerase sigma-70 factor (sigma-E family)
VIFPATSGAARASELVMGKLGSTIDAKAGGLMGIGSAGPTPVLPDVGAAARCAPDPPAEVAGTDFGDFYARHFPDLVRLATLLCGSTDTAPDLVQDCFVRLHGRWAEVHDPLPYVRRSVVHACASHHRHVARGRRLPSPVPQSSELGADELEDALEHLPARQRAAVVLRYYGDLPDADIARALRCRPGTVRSLIHRALADLRKVIEP